MLKAQVKYKKSDTHVTKSDMIGFIHLSNNTENGSKYLVSSTEAMLSEMATHFVKPWNIVCYHNAELPLTKRGFFSTS